MISMLIALALVADQPAERGEPASPAPVVDADFKKADWAYLPSADDMLRTYPKAAFKAGVSGRAVVACTVLVTGRLKDCVVAEESGDGFGQAGLDLASTLRMKPATRAGVPVEDSIRIPLVWKTPSY